MKGRLFFLLSSFAIVTIISCKSFMHGYTWSKAENSYYLVTGDKDNFGDRRLKYNKGFHSNSALSNFLDCKCNDRGMPGFIYEYMSDTKCRGIKLFYPKLDSVFVFEEPKKGRLNSILKESRKMDDYERQTFDRLKSGK
ncbi:MAG: hypothetical protein E6Q39_02110 [Crocinitomicaceae bacterium]|nr:MAG: hypothetical protein E6Q39_02110 [Crocinitomicaceae bacterium]